MAKKYEKVPIERFINELICCRNQSTDEEKDTIIRLFTNGYCYHFAQLLKMTYPGGQIMLCWPRPHVVYQYNKKCYDINGEFDISKSDVVLIPFNKSNMKELYEPLRKSFLHVRDYIYPNDFTVVDPKIVPAVTDYRVSIKEMITIYINFVVNGCLERPLDEISGICLTSFHSVSKYIDKKVKDMNNVIDYWFQFMESYEEIVDEKYVWKTFKQIFTDKLYPVYMDVFLHTCKYDVPSMYPKLCPEIIRRMNESNIIKLARSARSPEKN